MSQPSSRESTLAQRSASESSSERPTLNSVLQNALETLDINLDDELARYRRHILLQQRASRQNLTQTPATTESPFSFDGLDDSLPPLVLPSNVDELAANVDELAANVTEANPELDLIEPAASVEVAPVTAASELVTVPQNHPPEAEALSLVPAAAESLTPDLPPNPDDYLESSEELLRSLEDEEKRAEAIAAESVESGSKQSLVDSIFTPLGVGSILLLILSSATLGYLVIRPSTLNMVTAWINGGSPSSPQSQAQSDGNGLSNLSPNLAAGEFDPLQPSNLSSLPGVVDPNALPDEEQNAADGENTDDSGAEADTAVAGTAPPDSGTVASTPATTTVPSSLPVGGTAPAPGRRPTRAVGPSLSTSLPTAPPQAAPSRPPAPRVSTPRVSAPPAPPAPRPSAPTPVRTTPVAPTPISPAPAAAIDPEPIPTPIEEQEGDPSINVPTPPAPPAQTSTPAPAPPAQTSTPAPSPSASTAAPPANSAPVQDDLYYVTTPYTGDQSLENAREAVSGSYVRSFPEGTQVQMGAFSNSDGAETLQQNLAEQGIEAEIYKEE